MPLVLTQAMHADGMRVLAEAPALEVAVVEDFAGAVRLPDAAALIVRKGHVDAGVVARAASLRLVSRHGVGLDNLDLGALAARGVTVTDVGDANILPVAEHTVAMILAVAKNMATLDRAVREGRYGEREALTTTEIAGKGALLLGFGRIGRHVARLLGAFGMRVMVHDPLVPEGVIAAAGCEAVADWRAALPRADVLSPHVPLDDATRGMIGAAEIAAMPGGAIIVNLARGGIVDEAALVAAVRSGHLRGAGLDVQVAYPPAPNDPLLTEPRIILSPHVAALTGEAASRMAVRAARNVVEFLAGTVDPAFVVGRR